METTANGTERTVDLGGGVGRVDRFYVPKLAGMMSRWDVMGYVVLTAPAKEYKTLRAARAAAAK